MFSLPKDEGFFNRYATLIPTLRKLGLLSQVINAITEVGIIYAVVYSMLTEFWGAYAAPLSVFGAIVGTGVIELGLRKFLPYSAKAILHRRFKGLDLAMSIFILITCFALFACSLTLSFKGSKAMVEAAAPSPDLLTTAAADDALKATTAAAVQSFGRDSGEVAARYAGLITSQKNAYTARINAERSTLSRYQNAPQKYTTLINNTKGKINALESEQAAKIAALEEQKAKEVQEAAARKNAATEQATANHAAANADVQKQNTDTRQKNEHRTRTYGSGLAWFTLIFHFILILAVALDEMNNKGSGIEQVAQPNQYHFSESIFSAFLNTLSDKWNYHARTRIKNWADKTPAPPRPSTPPTLYELADWKPQRVTLPTIAPELLTTPPGNGVGPTNGRAQNLRATGGNISVTMPATEQPPRPRNNAMSYVPPAKEKVVNTDTSLKPCGYCGELFRPRTTWQKFCKPECKLAEHEQRHGQPFDPAKAKFKARTKAPTA